MDYLQDAGSGSGRSGFLLGGKRYHHVLSNTFQIITRNDLITYAASRSCQSSTQSCGARRRVLYRMWSVSVILVCVGVRKLDGNLLNFRTQKGGKRRVCLCWNVCGSLWALLGITVLLSHSVSVSYNDSQSGQMGVVLLNNPTWEIGSIWRNTHKKIEVFSVCSVRMYTIWPEVCENLTSTPRKQFKEQCPFMLLLNCCHKVF